MATRNQGNSDQDNKGTQGTKGSGGTSNRGFASMDPQRQREIAAEGGRAAHASGNAHEFTPAEAAAAGRKGGQASHSGRASANAGANPGGSQGGTSGAKSLRGGSSEPNAEAGRPGNKNDR